MIYKGKLLATIVFATLSSTLGFSQSTFELGAEYRLNPLFSDGFRIPRTEGEKTEFYVNQRTRLILNYEKKNDLKTEIIFQDLRSWGTYKVNGPAGNFSFFRAWAEKNINEKWSVKLGRQGLIYDDQYVFGGLNWGGNMAHDAGLLKFQDSTFQAHLGFIYHSNGFDLTREEYEYKNHKTMQFLWMHKDAGNLSASFLFLNRGLERPDGSLNTYFNQTTGANVSYKFSDKFSLKGIFYYQFGDDTVATKNKISAYLYSLQASYKASDKLKFTLGTDVLSGEAMNSTDNTKNNFDQLFGLRHGHFGYLDYFYVKLWPETGLEDYYLKTDIKLSKKTKLAVHWHSFFSQATVIDPESGLAEDDYYGSEIDLKLTIKQSADFKASLGFSHMWVSDTYEAYYNNNNTLGSSAIYAVIVIKPTLFSATID